MTEHRRENDHRLEFALRLDDLCERFEAEWKQGGRPDLGAFLGHLPAADTGEVFDELLAVELEYRLRKGEHLTTEEYRVRYPQFADRIERVHGESLRRAQFTEATQDAGTRRSSGGGSGLHIRCPYCHYPIEIRDDQPLGQRTCPVCGSTLGPGSAVQSSSSVGGAGTRLAHFVLLEQVGQGSYGIVWKARDEATQRLVALKIPRVSELSADELDRFVREAQAAARCQHSGIVTVYEVGFEGSVFFIASQFIEGPSLRDHLARRPEPRLPVEDAVRLGIRIAEALDHAHEAGVVHRDLKPANILLNAAGEPHITDFGLAKRETGDVTITRSGMLLGTVQYMSPEQARGDLKSVGRRSDIYSLGTILFELLTGEKPFRGTTEAILRQVQEREPPRVRGLNPSVSRDLEAVCLRCLEKDPRKRFPTARELGEDLQRCLRGEPTRTRPVGRLGRGWRWCRRNPVVTVLGLAVLTSLFAGMTISLFFAIEARRRAGEVERGARIAESLRLAAEARVTLSRNSQRSLRSAVDALMTTLRWQEPPPPAARQALRDVLDFRSNAALVRVLAGSSGGQSAFVPGDAVVSPDGGWLMTVARDNALRRWDLRVSDPKDSPLSMLLTQEEDDPVGWLAVTPDSRWLVTVSATNIRLWDLAASDPAATSGDLVRLDRSFVASSVPEIAASQDGHWLAIAACGSTRLIDLHHGLPWAAPLSLNCRPMQLQFSPDGRWLAATLPKKVRLWNLNISDISANSTDIVVGHQLKSTIISPDSRSLFTIRDGYRPTKWDLTRRQPTATAGDADADWTGIVGATMSPDGRWLAVETSIGLRLWDMRLARFAAVLQRDEGGISLPAPVPSAPTSPPASAAPVSPDNGDGRLESGKVSPADGRESEEDNDFPNPSDWTVPSDPDLPQFSPDSRRLVGLWQETVCLWDLPAASSLGAEIGSGEHASGVHPTNVLQVDYNTAVDFAFGIDAGWLATGGADGTARIWKIASPASANVASVLGKQDGPIEEVEVLPKSRRVVTWDGWTACVWRLDEQPTPQKPLVLRCHLEADLPRATLSPNGRWFVAGEVGTPLRLWDLDTQSTTPAPVSLLERADAVSALAMSADNRWFVVASQDSLVRAWELKATPFREQPLVLEGQNGKISALAISPDSRWLLIGTEDGTISQRNLSDSFGEGSARLLSGHKAAIRALTLSPDGHWLLSEGFDHAVFLWDLAARGSLSSPREWRGRLAGLEPSPPLPDEWQRAIDDRPTSLWNEALKEFFRVGPPDSPSPQTVPAPSWPEPGPIPAPPERPVPKPEPNLPPPPAVDPNA